MQNEAIRDEIARIESQIESLDESIARCRKLSLAAKLAICAGAAWIVLTLTLIVGYEPAAVFGALAAMIGGVVLLGSNSTTWEQMETAREAAEKLRADLIGGMELRVVDSGVRRIH